MQTKVERLIGLATKAGKVITGLELCEKTVKANRAKLVVLAKDISETSKKFFVNTGIDIVYVDSKIILGKCTGKEIRTVAVITDSGFADAILEAFVNNNM